jgi:DNA topoisomerase-1
MTDFLYGTTDFAHIYTCSQPVKVLKYPPTPLTTSRLQQVASNELHYSPKDTMRLCQNLYEAGYITYMRTDSKTYSGEFIEKTKGYIIKTYSEQYINENISDLITGTNENGKKVRIRQSTRTFFYSKNHRK